MTSRKTKPLELKERRDEVGDRVKDRLWSLKNDNKLTVEGFADRCGGVPLPTVREWLNRGGLPSAAYLVAIAKGFQVTTDWILFGSPRPKHPNQSKTDTELAAEVGAYVSRQGLMNLDLSDMPGWVRDSLRNFIRGEVVLDLMVKVAEKELRANALWTREKRAIGEAISEINDSIEKGQQLDPQASLSVLRRLYAAATPPPGQLIQWRPVVFRRANPQEKTDGS